MQENRHDGTERIYTDLPAAGLGRAESAGNLVITDVGCHRGNGEYRGIIQNIRAIGITNQRETTIVWDKKTGEPVYNAIVWQCRRTAEQIDELKEKGYGPMLQKRTGLVPDAYFPQARSHGFLIM